MKTAGILIEDWKLPIFKKYLDAANYSYGEPTLFNPKRIKQPAYSTPILLLKVQYEWVAELKPIIDAAAAECAGMKRDS